MAVNRYFLWCVALALFPCSGSATPREFAKAELLGNIVFAQRISVPITPNTHGIIVRVQINGKDATMIVDSGAVKTIISESFIKGKGIKVPVNTAGGNTSAKICNVDLTLGDAHLTGVSVLALDTTDVSNRAGIKIDGFLGLDILTSKQGTFHVDLHNGILHLGE